MSTNLETAVGQLQRLHQELEAGKQLEVNGHRYRELREALEPLLVRWNRLQQRSRTASSLGAAVPAGVERVRKQLREMLHGDFGRFEQAYLSRDGVQAVKKEASWVAQELPTLEEALQKAIDGVRSQTMQQVEDIQAKARIRKQCGLPTNEPAVSELRDGVQKFFANLGVLSYEARVQRWAELARLIARLQAEHSLDSVSGLGKATLTFLQRLMSESKSTLTLADLTPAVFDDLRQFPSLLARVSLVRKGGD